MYTKKILLKNKSGLHARPASELVALAKKFESKITVRNADDENALPVNAKSIVRLLSAGLSAGTTIEVFAEGQDEAEAVTALIHLIEHGMDEEDDHANF